MAHSRRTASVFRTDVRDSQQKKSFVRFTAASNPQIAEKMATAIANDTSLLAGLAVVVKLLCKHEGARSILQEVFKQPNVSKKYSRAYKEFASAILFG